MSFLVSGRACYGTLATAVFTWSCLSLVSPADAQRRDTESLESAADAVADIEPYDGPPIFLDEPEPSPPAQIVERTRKTEDFPDGSVRLERELARYSDDRFEADGGYREYYPNGQVFVQGRYRSGKRHDEWSYFHDNGTLSRKVTYKNGLPDGSWEIHRADGTLEAERSFHEGKRHGKWITYDESGERPLTEAHFAEGLANGMWRFWFPSGQLQRQISFKNGKRDGPATEWYEDGRKRVETTYVDNLTHGTTTQWSEDGRTIVLEFDHGKLLSRSSE